MAALVQTYPQQTGTVTLLQSRPNTSPDIMAGSPQGHTSQQYGGNTQRNTYHTLSNSTGGGQQNAYRGNTSGPIQPYAFTSTPSLGTGSGPWQQYGAYRGTTGTIGTMPPAQHVDPSYSGRPLGQGSSSTAAPAPRTQSATGAGTGGQPTFAQVAAAKASPERYRRPVARHTESSPSMVQQSIVNPAAPSGNGMATVVHLYNPRAMAERSPGYQAPRPQSAYGTMMQGASVDDMQVYQQRKDEEVRRFRRRSMHSIDFSGVATPMTPQDLKKSEEARRLEASRRQATAKNPQTLAVPQPASSAHSRSASSESLTSSRSSNSRPSSANRNSNVSVPTSSPASTTSVPGDKTSNGLDQVKQVNIPPRNSSTDVGNRAINPSPLSQPAKMATESSSGGSAAPSATSPSKPTSGADSPAAKHLAAINEKGGKGKTKTSRLRRAFSFGSAAELQKASGGKEGAPEPATEANKLHKEPQEDDLYEQEQARIAQKQEEGGIGASIYSGTKLFSGSTDNLSISSTASSASIMLRKMGRGVKKSGRSLAGLFRPKSVIGAPIGDASPTEGSQAAVTMVTVEAERERVNVTADLHSQQAGGTGFPHLERNSIDATKADVAGNVESRKSIVGGEKERAEVLATIRKGILKTRSDSPTGSIRGQDTKSPAFELPPIPNVSDSPNSSQPSTPNDEVHQGHRRSGSVAIGSEDYFVSALRLRQDTKSAPTTPQGSSKRNTTFSPRIVFYDTFNPSEYDRRGEIATCNRLTPMLAQQIKEELNTFKMEMEVHETSKIYTHFF